MCFHVPSFAFLTFGPAMWLTAQDQPTIGNAATIRMIPAASTTIGLKKISRIRFIRFLRIHYKSRNSNVLFCIAHNFFCGYCPHIRFFEQFPITHWGSIFHFVLMNYFPLPARCRRSLPIRCYQFLLFYAYRAQHSKIGVFISYFLQGFFYGFRSVFSTNPCRKHTFFCRIIFSCFDCDLIARHPYSLLSCPPIEVHRRRNTAFITVLVVETDDCTAVFLIGAPNAFHARDAHDFIGRCTAEGHSRLLGSMCAFIFSPQIYCKTLGDRQRVADPKNCRHICSTHRFLPF